MKRYIVERTLLVTHQTVVYATDESDALARFKRGDVDSEQKPFYNAPAGAVAGTVKVYAGQEQ